MLNYTQLKETILDYINYHDDEITGKVDFFIDTAEKEIARVLRLPCYEKIVTLVPKNQDVRDTVVIPSDYIESKSMFIAETSQPIKMGNFEFIMRKRAGIDKSTEGSGYYYARVGNNFVVYPPIPEEQTVLLNYYADPKNLEQGSDSSYILTVAPDLLLFTAIKHAYIFLNNDEDAAKYNGMAANALKQVETQIYRMDNKPSQKVVPRRF